MFFKDGRAAQNVGLLILRVGIGLIFFLHGYPKLLAGPTKWIWLGTQMKYVGISFAPVLWGFIAAVSECIGGILLALGLYTRLAAFFMGGVMLVALTMHLSIRDSFAVYAHSLSLFVVFASLFVAGAGSYSLDTLFSR